MKFNEATEQLQELVISKALENQKYLDNQFQAGEDALWQAYQEVNPEITPDGALGDPVTEWADKIFEYLWE